MGNTKDALVQDDNQIPVPTKDGTVDIDPINNTIKIGRGKGSVTIDIADAKDNNYGFTVNAGVITWKHETSGKGEMGLNLGAGGGWMKRDGSTVTEIGFNYGISKYGIDGHLELVYKNQGDGNWHGTVSVKGPLGISKELVTFDNHFPQNIDELTDLVKDDFVALMLVKELDTRQRSILEDMEQGRSEGELVYPYGPRTDIQTDKVSVLLANLNTDQTMQFAEKFSQLNEKLQGMPGNIQQQFRDNFCDQFAKEAQAGIHGTLPQLATVQPIEPDQGRDEKSITKNIVQNQSIGLVGEVRETHDAVATKVINQATAQEGLPMEAKAVTSNGEVFIASNVSTQEPKVSQSGFTYQDPSLLESFKGYDQLLGSLKSPYLTENQKDNLALAASTHMKDPLFLKLPTFEDKKEIMDFLVGSFNKQATYENKFDRPVDQMIASIEPHVKGIEQRTLEDQNKVTEVASNVNDGHVRVIERS